MRSYQMLLILVILIPQLGHAASFANFVESDSDESSLISCLEGAIKCLDRVSDAKATCIDMAQGMYEIQLRHCIPGGGPDCIARIEQRLRDRIAECNSKFEKGQAICAENLAECLSGSDEG